MYIWSAIKCMVTQLYLWMFPLHTIESYVERVDINRYKVVIKFPERDVAIQFKRPRGPLQEIPDHVKPEMIPYLQNDRKTPIVICKGFKQK